MSNKAKKIARRDSPGGVLQRKLGICSKDGNLSEALKLYHDAKVNNVNLDVNHYNVLLYLCSSNSEGLDMGFEIFKEMSVKKVDPNEAFELIKKMKTVGILPKLRSYRPALFGFCNLGMADKGYDVHNHMAESGVLAEEAELRALLKVSMETKKADKVYEMMQRLRTTVRQVSEDTAEVIDPKKKMAEKMAGKWLRNGKKSWPGNLTGAGKVGRRR